MTSCDPIRELIHRRLDGDLDAAGAATLDEHLAICGSCRTLLHELSSVGAGLRSMPLAPMPDNALEAVLDRTVRAHRRAVTPSAFRFRWSYVAAAAVLAAVAVTPFLFRSSIGPAGRPEPTVAEARREAERVLALTARALRRGETAARDRVLAGEISPALKRVPVRWKRISETRRHDK